MRHTEAIAAFVVPMVEGPDELLYDVSLIQGTVVRWKFTPETPQA